MSNKGPIELLNKTLTTISTPFEDRKAEKKAFKDLKLPEKDATDEEIKAFEAEKKILLNAKNAFNKMCDSCKKFIDNNEDETIFKTFVDDYKKYMLNHKPKITSINNPILGTFKTSMTKYDYDVPGMLKILKDGFSGNEVFSKELEKVSQAIATAQKEQRFNNIKQELIITENSYINGLNQIPTFEKFLKDFEVRKKDLKKVGKVITEDQINQVKKMLDIVPEIIKINLLLRDQFVKLKDATEAEEVEAIANEIKNLNKKALNYYTVYAPLYDTASSILSTTDQLNCVKVIQRYPRYIMLFKDLEGIAPDEIAGTISGVREIFEAASQEINQKTKIVQNRLYLQENYPKLAEDTRNYNNILKTLKKNEIKLDHYNEYKHYSEYKHLKSDYQKLVETTEKMIKNTPEFEKAEESKAELNNKIRLMEISNPYLTKTEALNNKMQQMEKENPEFKKAVELSSKMKVLVKEIQKKEAEIKEIEKNYALEAIGPLPPKYIPKELKKAAKKEKGWMAPPQYIPLTPKEEAQKAHTSRKYAQKPGFRRSQMLAKDLEQQPDRAPKLTRKDARRDVRKSIPPKPPK